MKEPSHKTDAEKIEVEVGGRGSNRTLQITCDSKTMTELAGLIYTKLQNVEAKPVPPHDVSEIYLFREGPESTAQQTAWEDWFWMFGCFFGVAVLAVMIVLMIVGAGTVGEWLFGG